MKRKLTLSWLMFRAVMAGNRTGMEAIHLEIERRWDEDDWS